MTVAVAVTPEDYVVWCCIVLYCVVLCCVVMVHALLGAVMMMMSVQRIDSRF
jgi:hypothetical protein